jgi:hypothetical protein
MTNGLAAPSVTFMRNGRLTTNVLIGIALTAVFSLTAGHLVDLGSQVTGSGPTSTPALVGDIAGLLACGASAWFGVRRLCRPHECP